MRDSGFRRRHKSTGIFISTPAAITILFLLFLLAGAVWYQYQSKDNETERLRRRIRELELNVREKDTRISAQRERIGSLEEEVEQLRRRLTIQSILEEEGTGMAPSDRTRLAYVLEEESATYGCDPLFLIALMMVESNLDPDAESQYGARGLMQLMPATGRSLLDEFAAALTPEELAELGIRLDGIDALHDPITNVRLGTFYLAKLAHELGRSGITPNLLRAYNMGPSRLRRQIEEGKPLPRDYVRAVERTYETLKQRYAGVWPPSPPPVPPTPTPIVLERTLLSDLLLLEVEES